MEENYQDTANNNLTTTENTLWLPPSFTNGNIAHNNKQNKTRHRWKWGFSDKTGWDYLNLIGILLVPLMIGVLTILTSIQQTQLSQQQHDSDKTIAEQQHYSDQAIALDQQRATILQTYIGDIQDLLLNHHLSEADGFNPSNQYYDVATLARARTLTALQGLQGDPERKGSLLIFLHEAQLIGFDDYSGKTHGIPIIVLSGANLSDANLSDANLSDANLSGADLSGADLSGADLSGADLSGANLQGTNLQGADLLITDLSGVMVSVKTNLSNAFMSPALSYGYGWLTSRNSNGGLDWPYFQVDVPSLNHAHLYPDGLVGANLSDTNLSGADLDGAYLSGANLSNANLGGTDLHLAHLSGADLRGAYLNNVHLWGADLSRANLDGEDLRGVDLSGANLRGADLNCTNLTPHQLDQAFTDAHTQTIESLHYCLG